MAGFSFGGDIESDAHECVKQFAAARGVQVEFPPIQDAGVFGENVIRYARQKQPSAMRRTAVPGILPDLRMAEYRMLVENSPNHRFGCFEPVALPLALRAAAISASISSKPFSCASCCSSVNTRRI